MLCITWPYPRPDIVCVVVVAPITWDAIIAAPRSGSGLGPVTNRSGGLAAHKPEFNFSVSPALWKIYKVLHFNQDECDQVFYGHDFFYTFHNNSHFVFTTKSWIWKSRWIWPLVTLSRKIIFSLSLLLCRKLFHRSGASRFISKPLHSPRDFNTMSDTRLTS